MHELSIAYNLVQIAEETARINQFQTVDVVHVKIGVLAGVVKEALLFSFDVATEGTSIEKAKLVVEEVPIKVYCSHCHDEFTLENPIPLRCPECEKSSNQIIEGKEIELYSIEGDVQT